MACQDPQFRRELGILLGPPIIDGNRVENFENGVEIFPAMLEAIRGARSTITFETYIYWSGNIGRRFADALSEQRPQRRARARADRLGGQPEDGRGRCSTRWWRPASRCTASTRCTGTT